MIDHDGAVADMLRTLWVWILISPGLGPLFDLLPELGLVFGTPVPPRTALLLGGLVAAGLVLAGERRYFRLLVTAFGTVIGWAILANVLGFTGPRVYGVPRLILAQFFLWVCVATLTAAIVFETGWLARLNASLRRSVS